MKTKNLQKETTGNDEYDHLTAVESKYSQS